MAAKIRKPHLEPSTFKKLVEEAKEKTKGLDTEVFMISFRQVDKSQGDSFHDWESKQLLAHALDVIQGYSSLPLVQQLHDKFKTYPSFPPREKTEFTFPKHVPPDAKWASMHVQGAPCLIGHVINNTFVLVFLDGGHKFWKSELKNT